MSVKAYLVELELHGVLIYSSEVKPAIGEAGGAIHTTSPYIHNYPLFYGFCGKNVESYGVIPALHRFTYSGVETTRGQRKIVKTPLQYTTVTKILDDLMKMKKGFYIFPAKPLEVHFKKFFISGKGMSYGEIMGALKTVFPRITHHVALVPPSRFQTVLLSSNMTFPRELFIRIGMKRMGIMKAKLTELEIYGRHKTAKWSSIPVNLRDVKLFGYSPTGVITVLETRSKPRNFPEASKIAYIEAENLYELRGKHGGTRIYVPLPHNLIETVAIEG